MKYVTVSDFAAATRMSPEAVQMLMVSKVIPAAIRIDVTGITEFLIEQADEALYHSKENGRNRVTHFDRLATQATGQV